MVKNLRNECYTTSDGFVSSWMTDYYWQFAVTPDARHILYGGAWDGSLRVWSLARGKEVLTTTRHTDTIR